jgi:hypothetical protein
MVCFHNKNVFAYLILEPGKTMVLFICIGSPKWNITTAFTSIFLSWLGMDGEDGTTHILYTPELETRTGIWNLDPPFVTWV